MENKQTETDNQAPPVAKVFGRAVSEWVTYSFIVLCAIALIFGNIVGAERDAQAERAMATLATLTEAAESKAAAGGTLICDDSLLAKELLANDYLDLSIRQAPIDEENKALGYGPALYVSVVEKDVSGDTWDTARRLMELVKEAGEKEAEVSEARAGRVMAASLTADESDGAELEDSKKPKNRLRELRKKGYGDDEEYLRYYILASEVATCDSTELDDMPST